MRTTATVLLATLLGLVVAAGAGRAEEKLTPEQRARLEKEATELHRRAVACHQKGRLTEATELAAQALALRRRLFPRGDFPDGHPDLAQSLNNLAALLEDRG